MCGIAGMISDQIKSDIFLHDIVIKWESLLKHRGPDGWGWYQCPKSPVLLFHRRLAITGVNNGVQPLASEDKDLWISFNGEIYNYKSIRRDLLTRSHRFRSETDAEVILHLYQEQGMEAIKNLNGDFAFALYDSKKGLIHLVRDRFGVKPLYYSNSNDSLYFSSELKAILAIPGFPRAIDHQTLQNHLQTFYFADETIFKNIKQLSPGHYLSYNVHTRKTDISAYWETPLSEETRTESKNDLVDEFKQRFRKAIKIRLPEEVNVGAYFSGGLDSSAIVQSMSNLKNDPFPVFSIGFENKQYNELHHTTDLVEKLNIEQHKVIIKKGNLKEAFLQSIWHSEIPVLNTHGAAKNMLANLAKNHCKVVLTGEGADEFLMGYGMYAHLLNEESGNSSSNTKASINKGQLSGKLKNYDSVSAFFGAYPYAMQRHFHLNKLNKLMLKGEHRHTSSNWIWQDEMINHMPPPLFEGLDSMRASQLFFLKTDFPAYLLNYLGDRQEMSASLEGRVPFLDHTLVDFMCRLPNNLKQNQNTSKYILREAFKDILDDSLRLRPKQVFYAPAFESINYFDDPAFFARFDSKSKFNEVGIFNYTFYKSLKGLIRILPTHHRLLPIVESIAIFILSMHMVHEFFIEDFETWEKHFAPLPFEGSIQCFNVDQ